MEQPVTRAEFNQLKEQVKRIEQKTEEIRTVRVEVASEDILNQLKALEQGRKEISQKQDEHLKQIKEEFASIEKRQKSQDEGLLMHSKHISALHEEVQGLREDLKAMATKDDLAKMKEEILDAIRNISSPGKN